MFVLVLTVLVTTQSADVTPPPATITLIEGFSDKATCDKAASALASSEGSFKNTYYRTMAVCVAK